ncbi:MAG: PKD domain-containing protein [Flavobacteriales bacterium]|nr:PKD domain-containing protein [Flavobacteriales bacterium]
MKCLVSAILLFFLMINVALAQCTQATGTVVITEPGCDGNSGQIEVLASGGTGPYEYGIGGWNTQTSNIFTGLSAGTYNVRILTADNCESWIYGVTLNYTPMEFSGSIVQQTCYDYVAGSVNIIPSRGVAPYTYSSDGGATYNSINFFQQLDVGSYSYKIKDANGCVEDASFTITKSHIDPSVVTTPVQCSGIMGTAVVTFGGPDNYTFSIDNNVSIQTATGTYSYTQLTPGNYQLQCSDINGCNETVDFVVGDENIASSITGVTHETCNDTNGVFTITTSNGVGPYQYSIDEGLTFVGTNQFTNLDEGVYQTKVIDSRGCESADTIIITNTGGVVATINQDTTICSGDGAVLEVNATGEQLSFNWDNGLSNDSIHSLSPVVTTQYNVAVTDVYGCTEALNVTIEVNDYPSLTTSVSAIDLCRGDSIAISSSGATTYLWSNGDTVANTIVNTPFGADSIIAYGYNGNCEVSISIPVVEHSIDASITDTQHVCIGNSTTLYVNSVTPVLYEWSNGTATASSQTVFPNTDTYYEVVLTDAYGCKDTLGTMVVVDEDVNLAVSPTTIEVCLGEEFMLEASGATDYLWSDGQTISLVNHTATANEVISVTGINGECSNRIDVPVTVLPLPVVDISANASSINTGDGIQFGVGASNASSYTWDFGDGTTANYSIPYHEFLFPGAYYVTLTGTVGHCSTVDTLLVYVGFMGKETFDQEVVTVYPNPTSDKITINIPSSVVYQVNIYNAGGKLMNSFYNETGETIISIEDYPTGVYYLEVQSEQKKIVKVIGKQ